MYGSKIKSLEFPEGLTAIGNNAFYESTLLTSVKLPSSVNSLGAAFDNCPVLTDIQIANGNTNYTVNDGIIYTKDMTELVCYPGGKTKLVVPNTVKKLRYLSLAYTNLTEITLPEGLQEIEGGTFTYSYSLESITIPSSVTKIGSAFSNCSALKEIIVKKPEGSIPGAPWAAPYGVLAVKWQP